jgi:hypothetical protein
MDGGIADYPNQACQKKGALHQYEGPLGEFSLGLVEFFIVFALIPDHFAVVIEHPQKPLLFPGTELTFTSKPCFLALDPIQIVLNNLRFGLGQLALSDPIIDSSLLAINPRSELVAETGSCRDRNTNKNHQHHQHHYCARSSHKFPPESLKVSLTFSKASSFVVKKPNPGIT